MCKLRLVAVPQTLKSANKGVSERITPCIRVLMSVLKVQDSFVLRLANWHWTRAGTETNCLQHLWIPFLPPPPPTKSENKNLLGLTFSSFQ